MLAEYTHDRVQIPDDTGSGKKLYFHVLLKMPVQAVGNYRNL